MDFTFDIDAKEHAFSLLNRMDFLRKEVQKYDVIIKVKDKEIPCHKHVLMAGSKYFEAMFSHDNAENKSGIVELKELDYNSVKMCIDYIYSGKMTVSTDKFEQLLAVASIMQLSLIVEQICSSLQVCLNPDRFFEIKKIAEKFTLMNLQDACGEFAAQNFDTISREQGFKEFDAEYVTFLLLSQKLRKSTKEDFKLKAILNWIKADVVNRKKNLVPMMNQLDLGKITPKYGIFLAENEEICHTSGECMRMLYVAGMKRLALKTDDDDTIITFDLSSHSLQAYKPATKQMKKSVSFPDKFAKNKFVAVNVKGFLYALLENKKVFKISTEEYVEWQKIQDMLFSHGPWLRAAVVNDYIFVTNNNTLEVYSISDDGWQQIVTGDVLCDQSEIVGYKDKVFSIGGTGISGTSNSVTKYDVQSKIWEFIPPMQYCRASPAAACYNNKIYVAGGISKGETLREVEYYDMISNIWTVVPPMVKPRNLFTLCAVDNKLFAVGCKQDPLSIEEYEESGSWKVITEKPAMEINAQATVTGAFPE